MDDKDLNKTIDNVEQEVAEPTHRSQANLEKIGKLLVKSRKLNKKAPKNIDKVTKKTFDDAVKYIETNEQDMTESNDDQKRLYAYVKNGLIKVRSSISFDELNENRKKLENIKTLNQDIDTTNAGEVDAKQFINALIDKIVKESKPSTIKQIGRDLTKGFLSQEGTMIGSFMKEFGFVGKAMQRLIPSLDKEAKAKSARVFDNEIARLQRKETIPQTKAKPETPIVPSKPNPITKSVDPGIVNKPSTQVAQEQGQEPIKIGNQKIYPGDPMYNKIMGSSKITEVPDQQFTAKPAEPSIVQPKPSETQPEAKTQQKEMKVSTLIIDKLIAKTVVLDKQPKPHIKLKSSSSIENKQFKPELLGEELSEQGPTENKGVLDSLKDMLLGGAAGQNIKKMPSIGNLAKTVISRAALPVTAGLVAASPYMMSEHGMEANPNETDNYKLNKPISEMGTWEKFTNKVGAKRQSIEEMMESGKKFDEQQASDIKKYYEIDVPQQNLMLNTKPTMIEQAAKEIPKSTEKVEAKATEVGAQPVIIQQSAPAQPAQQTPQVIPMAGSVRPSESAWQRHQDRTVK